MTGHTRSYELNNGEKRWAIVVYLGKKTGKDEKLRDAYDGSGDLQPRKQRRRSSRAS